MVPRPTQCEFAQVHPVVDDCTAREDNILPYSGWSIVFNAKTFPGAKQKVEKEKAPLFPFNFLF